jgi:hypothetical protein
LTARVVFEVIEVSYKTLMFMGVVVDFRREYEEQTIADRRCAGGVAFSVGFGWSSQG